MKAVKDRITKEREELALAARPLVEWVRKNGTPHTTILVTDTFVNFTTAEVLVYGSIFEPHLNDAIFIANGGNI